MSGIPIQRRTEYCFYIKATRDPLVQAYLYFKPVNDTIKYDINRLSILSDEGQWWFTYQKPWEETYQQPSRSVVFFGTEELVQIGVRKLYRNWNNVCIVPLKITTKPIRVVSCEICNGDGKQICRDDPSMPFEAICKNCKGVGKCEWKPQFDFIDEDALLQVKKTKTKEGYETFIKLLEGEKEQRAQKQNKRR